MVAVPQLHAATSCQYPELKRPSIGLVLGGGGARGSAHIGVIRVLEELNIPIDYVAGTSIGSLVGALYATGMNSDELEQVITGIDWDDLFVDDTDRKEWPFRRKRDDDLALFGPKLGIGKNSSLLSRGAIGGQKVSFLFETLVKQRTHSSDFSKLPVPYRAVATDLATGGQVVLEEGDLALAMRASMSVPGLFDPVTWGDYMLVDGGLVNNVPIDVVRDMGADIVIAVNVGTGLTAKEDLDTMLAVVGQLTNFMTKTNTDRNIATLTSRDILIEPPLGDQVTSASFDKAQQGIKIGYEAASGMRNDMAHLGVSRQEFLAYRDAVERCVTGPPPIQFVRLDNRSRFDDSVIMERITIKAGDSMDIDTLKSDVSDIYALGFLDIARYEIVEDNGETGVLFHVKQDSRGTQFVETGLDYSGSGDNSALNVRLTYLNSAVDEYGSELRVLAQLGETPMVIGELYKYVEPELKLYVQPMLFAERREITQYDNNGNALQVSQVNQFGGALGIGREFGRSSALVGGVRLFSGSVDMDVGPPETPDYHYNGGEYFLRGTYDRLDDRYFPGSGSMVKISYYNSRDELGADEEYEQLVVDAISAATFGTHTLMGGLRYYETLDGEAPDYALFRGGGFTRLSGFVDEERAGQNFGMLLAGYRYHFAGSGILPAYLGGTLEYGQVTDDADDIFDDGLWHGSLYFGYHSPIGPLYLGVGTGQGGSETFFLRVGNIFGNSSVAR